MQDWQHLACKKKPVKFIKMAINDKQQKYNKIKDKR